MTVVAHGQAALAGVLAAGGLVVAAALVARGRAIPVGRVAALGEAAQRQAGQPQPVQGQPVRAGRSSGLRSVLLASKDVDSRRIAMGMVTLGLLASLAAGSLAPAVGCMVLLAVGHRIRMARRRRLGLEFDAALPDLLDGMTAALRAGATARVALVESAAGAPTVVTTDVGVIVGRLDRGEGLANAMAWWARHRARPQLDVLAAVMATSAEFGGPLADVLASVAAQMREDLRSRDEVRTQSAQAVASAAMLVSLPLVSLGISAVADPGVIAFLFATPFGALCLVVGGALEVLGAWWMSSIVRGVQ